MGSLKFGENKLNSWVPEWKHRDCEPFSETITWGVMQ